MTVKKYILTAFLKIKITESIMNHSNRPQKTFKRPNNHKFEENLN